MRIRILFFLLFLISSIRGQSSYYTRNDLLSAPTSSFNDGLIGFTNPANIGFFRRPESRFAWTSDGGKSGGFNDWGFFSGGPGLGFGIYRQNIGDYKVTDYKISTGFGSDAFSTGLSYGWSGGDKAMFNREKMLSTGSIIRPNKYLSFGLLGNFSLQSNSKEGVGELSVRPFGTTALTLFADGVLANGVKLKDSEWSAGAALLLVEGVQIVGRYFDSKAATVGLLFNFGRGGMSAQSHYDKDNNLAFNSYMIHAGQLRPSFVNKMVPKKSAILPLNLSGRIDYMSFSLFDDGVIKFSTLLKNIKAAANDPKIGAIVVNLSSTAVLPELAWEVREALKEAQSAGIKIVAFIENTSMTNYHLASIADVIVMDPEGILQLPGYVMSRTYMKGTLEKLGLGFDEWRFFKYKSAMENFSRDRFSDADREQRQGYIDSQYELVREEVCESRSLTNLEFDEIINESILFSANLALEKNLVDTLGRWSDLDEILKKIMAGNMNKTTPKMLYPNALVKDEWGPKPTIALVYGLGETSMNTGIRARWLEKEILKLEKDDKIKAIVFRADSPGGNAMAADLVAQALKRCKATKPVIITQGQVAGSGGYWISMYGDEIIAGPNTITGSIGVIGGWVWDKGFSDKLGMSYDKVQRGAHADALSGVRFPLIGLQVPARNLTIEEREKIEAFIRTMYNSFTSKVADGRKMPVEKVREIAEGHFYSGLDGKEIGLVDQIGGLMTAIAVAKQRAGIPPQEEINLIEIPKNRGLLDLPFIGVSLVQKITDDPVLRYLQLLTESPGKPLFMMTPDSYPTLDSETRND